MQPYIKAMTWAFWRERRIHFISFIILASTFSVSIRQFIPIFEKYKSMQLIYIFAVFFEIASLGMLIISAFGSSVMNLKIPDQLYVKPVSSRFLTLVYLAFSILSAIVIHLIAVLLYRFVGHLDWPLISPLIGFISIILCAYSLYWIFSDSPLLCVISITVTCGFIALIFIEFIKRQVSPSYFLFNIMPYLLIVDTFALVISFKAIKHARYGEKIRSVRFWERFYLKLKALLPGTNWKLNSPQKAYFWLLFRNGGFVFPMVNIFFILIISFVSMFTPENEKGSEVISGIIAFAIVNLFFLPIFSAGIVNSRGNSDGLSYQIAIRPISESSILKTLLKAFMANYIAGWIIYLIGASILILMLALTGNLDLSDADINKLIQVKSFFLFPKILIYPLGIWAIAGLISSLFLTGRNLPVFIFFSLLFLTPITIMLTNTFGSKVFNDFIVSSLIWFLALGGFGGTILAILYAIRKFLISSRFVGILIGVYVSFCIIGLILNFSVVNTPANAVILCGMLALPFAPFATAPLALYWNRHR
ncbi:MAG: hypothetical protein JXA96_03295 [Sedimentisphaerales bacterium]|nr:hypothetical protein [Sedimentisphaerales bacterium]